MPLYRRWNKLAAKWLWALVIVSLLAVLPLAYQRVQTERSANNVEVVFDYRDLVQIAKYHPDSSVYLKDQLALLKRAGVHSMAVYESTLEDFRDSGKIRLFSSRELFAFTAEMPPAGENDTYLLFADAEVKQALQPLIEQTFRGLEVEVAPWSYNGFSGLRIQAPSEYAVIQPMDPDPLAIRSLKEAGFQVVVRLSDARPFSAEAMDALLARLEGDGVRWIIFSGDAVSGFDDDAVQHSITTMAQLMNEHGIGLAAIEQPPAKQQKGLNKLAYLTGYNVVRLHSILEKEATQPDDRLADRMVLAVKDRNIRMIYLNAEERKDPINNVMTNSLHNLIVALNGPDGAVPRIERLGFDIGTARPFDAPGPDPSWLRGLVALGAVAFIALTLGLYLPSFRLLLFVLGLIGAAGLYTVSSSMMLKLLALGAAICAPVLAVIFAVRTLDRYREAGRSGGWAKVRAAVWLLLRTSFLSWVGALYIIGLLHNITFYLVLEQFRGVSLLHLAPFVLVGIYLLFFDRSRMWRESVQRMRRILFYKVNVLLVIAVAVCGAVIWFYLSRTGNAGHASAFERTIRAFLENTLGVRPRSKELLTHPFLILGVYFALKHRQAVYLFVIAAIAQLSILDTFAHLHSPVLVSLIRAGYGVFFGGLIGLALVGVWNVALRGYRAWKPTLKP